MYRAQQKAGYEADKWDIYVVPCRPDGSFDGSPKSVTDQFDLSADEFVWLGNKEILFAADQKAAKTIRTVDVDGVGGTVAPLVRQQHVVLRQP